LGPGGQGFQRCLFQFGPAAAEQQIASQRLGSRAFHAGSDPRRFGRRVAGQHPIDVAHRLDDGPGFRPWLRQREHVERQARQAKG
jgi:hypothetical protein